MARGAEPSWSLPTPSTDPPSRPTHWESNSGTSTSSSSAHPRTSSRLELELGDELDYVVPLGVSSAPAARSSHETTSQPTLQQGPISTALSKASNTSQARSYLHTRSQSLSEPVRSSDQYNNSRHDTSNETSHQQHQQTLDRTETSQSSTSNKMASQAELVRRHHTLSTSSSRLVRLERSRARLALQGVGLSEEDQEYYVPPSPVKGSVWSDIGHDSSGDANLNTFPTFFSPASSNSLAYGAVGEEQIVTIGVPVPTSSLSAANPNFHYSDTLTPNSRPEDPWSHSAASTPSFNKEVYADGDYVSPPTSAPVVVKKSSFVVLRGAKGDAALSERRPLSATIATSPTTPTRPLSQEHRTGATELSHRNSLKAVLDAENTGDREDWEQGLQDERDREEMHLRESSYSSYALDPQAGHFGVHSRANTYHQPSSGTWGSAEAETTSSLRRHQSLNNFKTAQPHNLSQELLPSLEPTSPSEIGASSRVASPRNGEETVHGSIILSPASNERGSLLGRSRSGTNPAPTYHHHHLHHTSSLRSQAGGNSPRSPLSHSNSLSSHSLGHANSIGRDRGTLSPVGGFSRSPWSPTVEETMALGSLAGTASLHRRESSSSKGSSHAASRPIRSNSNGPSGGFVEEFRQLELAATTSPSPPAMLSDEVQSLRAEHNPSRGTGAQVIRSATGPQGQPRRLPPLSTNLETATAAQQLIAADRHGPASAAAFVPPIGHSYREVFEEQSNGAATAMPGDGVGTSAYDWQMQKELLMGQPGGATASHANHSWNMTSPPSSAPFSESNYGVTWAMQQQQQQIQILQSQMQQATEALNLMRQQSRLQSPNRLPISSTSSSAQHIDYPQALLPSPRLKPLSHARDSPIVESAYASKGGFVHPGSSYEYQTAPTPALDMDSLAAKKGYNPVNFDLQPKAARFFVIKSYTEEDVHKSLKYEIWASTDLGNKRLDRAFRESSERGPIYLFFSVNGSGHFAGVAEMLTPVDYTTTSNVWASDKWKGVLKVRWIYIKDVPLSALRHIRLSNTNENKPVTSSRDTQEVPYDAGLEVLRVIAEYSSRTTLLQDYGYYEARTEAGMDAWNPTNRSNGAKLEGQMTSHKPHYARMAAPNQPSVNGQMHLGPAPPSVHQPQFFLGSHPAPNMYSPYSQQPAVSPLPPPPPHFSQGQSHQGLRWNGHGQRSQQALPTRPGGLPY